MKSIEFLFLILSFSSCKSQAIKITPINALNEVDTLKHDGIVSTYRTDYFFIKANSRHITDTIRIFVSKNLDSSLLKYSQYDMKFYKETDNLNIELLKQYDQKHKALEGEKPFITYTWFARKLVIH